MNKLDILIEFARCYNDPIYAIETYFQAYDITQSSYVPFKLMDKQKEIIMGFEENDYNLIAKPRQAGVSTTTAAYIAIKIAFSSSKSPEKVIILANKRETAKEVLKKVREFISQLPAWVNVKLIKDAEFNFILNNKSECKAVGTSKDALRGYAPTYVIFDEAAFISDAVDTYTAALASIATGGKMTLLSCVAGNTRVYTNKGFTRIDHFSTNQGINDNHAEYSVLGYKKLRNGLLLRNAGVRDTVKIRSEFMELEVATNHLFYIKKGLDYELIEASKIRKGQNIYIMRGTRIFGKRKMYATDIKDNIDLSKPLTESASQWDEKTSFNFYRAIFDRIYSKKHSRISFPNEVNVDLVRTYLLNVGIFTHKLRKTCLKLKGDDIKRFYYYFYKNNDFLTRRNRTYLEASKVIQITKSKAFVYDFSLPNKKTDKFAHSVLYNGIFGHQTPNGFDPVYYKTYALAKEGKNKFNVIEMRWYQDKRYNKNLSWHKDETSIKEEDYTLESYEKMVDQGYKPRSPWYLDMCAQLGFNEQKIAQELDVSFIGSGGNVIGEELLEVIQKTTVKTPEFTYGEEQSIWVWEEAIPGEKYIMGADVSRGDGNDYSVISIVKFSTGEQVLEAQVKMQPDLFGDLVNDIGLKYNAYVAVDITGGMGAATIFRLMDLKYPYLHYDTPRQNLIKDKMNYSQVSTGKIPGFTIGNNRTNIIAEMERAIRTGELVIRSQRLLNELKTFIYINGKPDHIKGGHSDCIMSVAMLLWVKNTSFKHFESAKKHSEMYLKGFKSSGNISSGNVIKKELKDEVNKRIRGSSTGGEPNYNWLF